MSQRARQREDTRQRLIGAARARFAAHGFDGTQLRDVAQEAGVALGTIFVHFTDKRDLLAASLFADLEAAIGRSERVRGRTFEDWLDKVTATCLEAYTREPALARDLLREGLFADPPWRERFAALIGGVAARVAKRAAAEKDAGRFAPHADVQVLAGAWVAFFTFAVIAWVQQSHPDPRRFVRALVSQHLKGVMP